MKAGCKCFLFVLFSVTGCLNGGGQIRPGDGETSKELLSRLDELYNSLRYQLLFKIFCFFCLSLHLLSLGHSNFSSSDPQLLSTLEVLSDGQLGLNRFSMVISFKWVDTRSRAATTKKCIKNCDTRA